LLGLPVEETATRALYLAADRPDQARLSLRRMVTTGDAWGKVKDRLRVMPGPPPKDIASSPTLLLEMAQHCDASLVVLDSLKDFSSKLSDDETGNRCNSAFQHVVADGRDILILHHVRKTGRQDTDRGVGLDDVVRLGLALQRW
jgi:hypothetical protein